MRPWWRVCASVLSMGSEYNNNAPKLNTPNGQFLDGITTARSTTTSISMTYITPDFAGPTEYRLASY